MAWTDRYVSSLAGGGGDGSQGTPWTLAEAIANAAGGDRVNVLDSGVYTLAGSITFPNGTNENPIQWRGYLSAIGDQEDVGRPSPTAALTVTGFPIIDGGANFNITLGQYSQFINIHFTCAGNRATVVNKEYASMWRCLCENTHATGAGVFGFNGSANNDTHVYDCDFSISSNSDTAIACRLGKSGAHGCRAWNDTNKNGRAFQTASNPCSFVDCICFNVTRAFMVQAGGVFIDRCTAYGVGTGVYMADATAPYMITDNIFYSISAYVFGGSDGAAAMMINNASGSVTSGQIDTANLGSVLEEKDAITLTADPFVDAAGEDFRLNGVAGGGLLCRSGSQLWDGKADVGATQTVGRGNVIIGG